MELHKHIITILHVMHLLIVISEIITEYLKVDQSTLLAGDPSSPESGSEGPSAEELVQQYMERVRTNNY